VCVLGLAITVWQPVHDGSQSAQVHGMRLGLGSMKYIPLDTLQNEWQRRGGTSDKKQWVHVLCCNGNQKCQI
jgi:hypothetical protein